MSTRWLELAVRRGVDAALANASAPGGLIDTTINAVMRDVALRNARFSGSRSQAQFVWDIAFHMMRTDRTMRAPEAKRRAAETLRTFLRDERITFGHPAYAWDQDAAETIARELETDHWETAA